jgi:membrane associated rhomboid family serine protease
LWPLGASAASNGQVSFQVWQLLTYGFLHGSFVHLLFNMFALYMFGGALEQVVGPRRFTAYYLVSVLAAAITQLFVMALAREIYPTGRRPRAACSGCSSPTPSTSAQPRLLPAGAVPDQGARLRLHLRRDRALPGVTALRRASRHFAHLGGLIGGGLMLAYWRRGRLLRR